MFRILLFVFIGFGLAANAQKIKKEDYFFIDKLVQDAGPMKGNSLAYIVDSITSQCKTELQVTRAFYRWETLYLSFDMKRYRHPENLPDNASSALMEREADLKDSQTYLRQCVTSKKLNVP